MLVLTYRSRGGGIIIDYNIIRNNRASDERAGLFAGTSGPGDIHMDGNLITGNSANTNACGAEIDGGSGNTYVTNNTIANNSITGPLLNGYGGLVVFGNVFVSNNISWGNTHTDIGAFSGSALVDNDYGTLTGTPTSNTGPQSIDPQFSGATDFHLLPTSPLLGAGTLTPPGNLPTIDIEGHPRSYNGLVDMGAYERGDKIFADGLGD